MKISVVIPARNEAVTLPACLRALAAQTRPADEILVVDNNSTDATRKNAMKFTSVAVLSQVKIGRVYARNLGFDTASGAIIARIDADTIVPPNWLERIEQFYQQPEHQRTAWTGAAAFGNIPWSQLVSLAYNWLVFRFNRFLVGHSALWGSNMALPAELWHDVRNEVCLDNALHEDLDLSLHLVAHGAAIRYDSRTQVRATMRRVLDDRSELWTYLQMWPATLRRHGKWTWPLCWLVGACGLYGASYLLVVVDFLRTRWRSRAQR